jgi:aminoglycoside 6'-N-acetyltransferase I
MEQADAVSVSAAWRVRAATAADAGAWSRLRQALWPQADPGQHAGDIEQMLARPENAAAFLLVDAEGEAHGFAEASLRRDYVNGTESSPVGFLEGWYVQADWRGRGGGRALIAAVEHWSTQCGVSELASDALLDNDAGHRAHQACGFEETERVVYFRKRLREPG